MTFLSGYVENISGDFKDHDHISKFDTVKVRYKNSIYFDQNYLFLFLEN